MTEGPDPFCYYTNSGLAWRKVRPIFHRYFRFWPDHEDLIWAKSVWPRLHEHGFYADVDEEAVAWTHRNILALAILYAASAWRFGTPDYQGIDFLDRTHLTVTFGSRGNLDEVLDEVGRSLCFSFPENASFEGDPDFFRPLIRSLATGSGTYVEGPKLERYLNAVEARRFGILEFREDALRDMWLGGHFDSASMACFP